MYDGHMIPLLLSALVLLVYMSTTFIIAVQSKDNSVADIAYGIGFTLISWFTYLLGVHTIAGIVVTVLVTLWGARLATRIYLKNRGKGEDFRYKKMREEWGDSFLKKTYLQIFLLQGLIIYVIALPVLLLNIFGNNSVGPLAILGLLVWLGGFFFETVGDAQLDAFLTKKENKGHIMQSGLWKYTRHPNYFGESAMWVGIGIICYDVLSVSWNPLYALVVFVSPTLITYLLLKVSGVPLLEAHFSGEEWEAYKASTNVFFPWKKKP